MYILFRKSLFRKGANNGCWRKSEHFVVDGKRGKTGFYMF
jgi:hypothetical protein